MPFLQLKTPFKPFCPLLHPAVAPRPTHSPPQALLLQMSAAGHGMFSYIPDASMIGTVFCNFIANAMYHMNPEP